MKLLKQLSIYTLVGVISAGINFFIMPILSHYLLPADYGLISLFNTYVLILLPLVSISAYSLLNVDYFKQKDKDSFAIQFSSIQVIPIVNTIVLGILVWSFYGQFADELEMQGLGISWGFIILGLTILNIYYDQFIQFLILQKKATLYALFSLLKVGIEIALTFYFIVGRGWNWEGRIYSWLIVSVVFFIVAFIYFYKQGYIKASIRWHYVWEGIVFGSPLILHNIGKFVINQSDRLFIIKMIKPDGIAEAGIYNIGYTVGSLVMIAVNAFFTFYSPYLMERLATPSEEGRLQIVKLGYWYMMGCVGLLLLVSIFAPILFHYFIDPAYIEGLSYVFWVALGYCFWGGYMLFSGFIFYLKKSRILGWLALFNVGTNIIFNYVFIKIFGTIGAAYATALSFFLVMLIVAFLAQKLLPMPWRHYKRAKLVRLS